MSLSDTALVTLVQAKNHLRKDEVASLQVFAEYVGMGDGSNKEFTLDNTPVDGSLKLYVDGSLQTETTHYSISDTTITFVTAPANNKPVTASYDYAASSDTFESYDDDLLEILINAATQKCEDYCGRAFIQRTVTETHIGDGLDVLRLYKRPVASITSVSYEQVDDFEGDGLSVTFTLSDEPMSGTYTVYVAGVLQTETTDYSISGETLTFVSAPADEALIIVRYNVELVENTDYTQQLSSARLKGEWYEEYEYQVVYTAGYDDTRAEVQADVPEAVLSVLVAVSNWYENRLGVKSENISGIGSVSYEIGELPPQAMMLLGTLKANLL
jgi:hypothetical protein